ncbi:RagB/SusD family nutrient uptake outer membrane protein [Pedobacter hiemivivus]|uniref:RagB/SusD family nutrient uptake outer membrane protein n=1 Tax=Pedobacter hiemivivus TaxID=2530454 RepID=A0A4R0NJN9_9SPHI|nr:RagB/SusD family nutrient uptake outer membrane protein [Pedobacter hiemivivus]TCC99652.1 RagB/SusD family nutrient uptake outer membrane protein [Pedobacter hiemivivus]
MKRISFIIMALLGLSSIISCKKFLDVKPKTEMPRDILFGTENGFKDALTGVYIQMKDNNAYGGAMTQTTIESLTSSWDVTANTTEQRIGLFNYTDAGVETALGNIFKQEYKVISSINAILGEIDKRRDIFVTPGLYETIKAECLALRAYCHLDILRLFGPVPTASQNGSMLAYVTMLSTTINQPLPFAEYRALLLKDLEDAAALSKDIDPITKYSLKQLRSPGAISGFNPDDKYFAYRYLRLNYYAVKALQARASLWFGDKDKAYEYAKVVIEAKNSDGTSKFLLGTAADVTAKDYVFTKEHLFGLYDFEMFSKYTGRYGTGTTKKGTSATTIKTQLFGNTGTDIRESGLWDLLTLGSGQTAYIIKKYQVLDPKTVTVNEDYKQIPMLRLSEMYLIAAESAPFAEGLIYFKDFRTARNIGNFVLPANPLLLQAEIIKEYRKEFYSEGQAFFAYKRNNTAKAQFLFAPAAATVNYLIPLPKVESANLN